MYITVIVCLRVRPGGFPEVVSSHNLLSGFSENKLIVQLVTAELEEKVVRIESKVGRLQEAVAEVMVQNLVTIS